MENRKIIVGTNSLDYNPRRNFGGLPYRNFVVQKKMDLFRILDYFYFKIKNKSHPFFSNAFFDFGLNNADLYHFFNSVSFSNKPWLVTFENEIPRPYLKSEYMVRRLTHSSCKKIIAFCNRAKEIETYLLDKYPGLKQAVLEKLIVLQPSQTLYIQSVAAKNYSGPVVFTFVGVDFFRKGGAEILQAAEQLINDGFDFRLNIVSRLQKGSWKDEHITLKDIEEAKRVIEKYKQIITHHYSLPTEKIMQLFMESHVGLLPSYGETYGYVVLEAQACGCPVITPAMPPFDEFNNEQMGWMVKVPLKKRNGVMDSDLSGENLQLFRNALRTGLYTAMKDAINNKEALKVKAANAIENIREKHSPEKNAEFLEELYRQAIA